MKLVQAAEAESGRVSVPRSGRTTSSGSAAFSLVEVTVAMGIFAFVAVGILGLLPAAMRLRAEAAQETRAVLIAQELFSAVMSSSSLTNVIIRDGPALEPRNNTPINIVEDTVVVGYPTQTTVPYGLFARDRGFNPQTVWETGALPGWAADNAIATLARLSATIVSSNLYAVTVEVRSPASLPLTNSTPTVFTTLVNSQ